MMKEGKKKKQWKKRRGKSKEKEKGNKRIWKRV